MAKKKTTQCSVHNTESSRLYIYYSISHKQTSSICDQCMAGSTVVLPVFPIIFFLILLFLLLAFLLFLLLLLVFAIFIFFSKARGTKPINITRIIHYSDTSPAKTNEHIDTKKKKNSRGGDKWKRK